MRKKRNLKKDNNAKVAIIFVGFVISIVLISLILKFVVVLSQSQFNSKRFTMTVSNNKGLEVLSFSPTTHTMSILKLDKNINVPLRQFLAIPIDGFIKEDSLDINQNADALFPKMIFNYKKLNTNLTIVDLIKLFIFARNLSESEIDERFISKDLTVREIDSLTGRLFNDEIIEKEGKKIQIINGTDVLGLGNRLARLIANMGGDVIIVANADSAQKTSKISYIDDKSYTVEKLSKVLGFSPAQTRDRTIADITITIGQDNLNSLPF